MDCRGDWREVLVPSEAPSGLRKGVGMPYSLSLSNGAGPGLVGVFELDRGGISGLGPGWDWEVRSRALCAAAAVGDVFESWSSELPFIFSPLGDCAVPCALSGVGGSSVILGSPSCSSAFAPLPSEPPNKYVSSAPLTGPSAGGEASGMKLLSMSMSLRFMSLSSNALVSSLGWSARGRSSLPSVTGSEGSSESDVSSVAAVTSSQWAVWSGLGVSSGASPGAPIPD